MKHPKALLVCILLVQATLVSSATSVPDAPFPLPHFTVDQAIQKAQGFFTGAGKPDEGWQIISIRFGNPDTICPKEGGYFDVDRSTWVWFITYANPKTGSSMIYQLTDDGRVRSVAHFQT